MYPIARSPFDPQTFTDIRRSNTPQRVARFKWDPGEGQTATRKFHGTL